MISTKISFPNVRWAHILIGVSLIVLLTAMITMSFDFGVTWDEGFQEKRGEQIIKFYQSGFKETGVFQNVMYGTFYDLLCSITQKLFSQYPKYEVRHVLNSVVGWIGISACVLISLRLFGPQGAFLCLLLFCASPRYLAHCMNNSKDMPFATVNALFLLALLPQNENASFLTWKRFGALGLLFGMGLGIRQAALFFLVYVGLFVWLRSRETGVSRRIPVLRVVGFSVAGLILGSLVAIAFWPGLVGGNITASIPELLSFPVRGGIHEFMGERVLHAPWYYSLVYFGIGLPLVVVTAGIASPWLLEEKHKPPFIWVLLLSAFLPFIVAALFRIRLYNEIRHLLFAYPPLVILAAGVWTKLWVKARVSRGKLTFGILLFVTLISHPLIFQIRNHPNQIVYYNPLIGGVEGAFRNFELDYWGNCYKQSVDWLSEHAKNYPNPVTFTTSVGGHVAIEYARKYEHLKYIKSFKKSDFWIRLVFGNPDEIRHTLKGYSPQYPITGSTRFTVEADGVPLCVVQERDTLESSHANS